MFHSCFHGRRSKSCAARFAKPRNQDFHLLNMQIRVGVVVFSTTAENIFYLNDYFTKQGVRNGIYRLVLCAALWILVLTPLFSGFFPVMTHFFRIPYIEGFTNTSGGLRLMRTEQFTTQRGDRPDVPNVAIVITDATSNKDQNLTIPEALAAQRAGVTMFTVGFTEEMQVKEQGSVQFRQEKK